MALPMYGQGDISFDPAITQQEFAVFSRLVAQSIYATPVDPARARGLLGFDVGVAAAAMPVDTNAEYWRHAVGDDFALGDNVIVPRLVASKGLSFATLSGTYSKIPGSNIGMWGGSLDVPLMSGGLVRPTLAVRAAYSTLTGAEQLDLKTYGVEVFLSKGFGPVTPYIAAGRARSDAVGRVTDAIILRDEFDTNRFTAGVKLSLLIPKIVVEATQGEERSYAAKVSFGL